MDDPVPTPDDGPLAVRRATPDDLEALTALFARARPEARLGRRMIGEKLFDPPRPGAVTSVPIVVHAATGAPIAVMQGVASPAAGRAWIGLFAVDPLRRGRGLATRLLSSHLDEWRGQGVTSVEVLGIPGNYAWPGVDERWTDAAGFLERSGFAAIGEAVNLSVDLASLPPAPPAAPTGFSIGRARPTEVAAVAAFAAREFGGAWDVEASRAGRRDPPGLFLARRSGEIVAFAAHSGLNREWGFFGPMGTAASCRGSGVGRALLLACLRDLRAAGHREAVIPWVGPVEFYERVVGARIDRRFRRYRRAP